MARPAMAPVTRSAKQLKARGLSQRRHRDLQRRVVVRSGKAASCRAFETRRPAWQAAAGGRRGATIGGDDHLQGGDRLAETVRNKHRRHDDPLRKSAREATMSARLRLRVSVVVEADGDGYHAYCPAFKGLHAAGETEDDAIEGARAAALAYLESMASHGDPIPVGPDCEVAKAGEDMAIPASAVLKPLELSWPTPDPSGTS